MVVRPQGMGPEALTPYGTGGATDGVASSHDGAGAGTAEPPSSASAEGGPAGHGAECRCGCFCVALWPFSGVGIPIRLLDVPADREGDTAESRPPESATLDTLLCPQDVGSSDPIALVRAAVLTTAAWYGDARDLAAATGLAPAIIRDVPTGLVSLPGQRGSTASRAGAHTFFPQLPASDARRDAAAPAVSDAAEGLPDRRIPLRGVP